MIIKEIDAQLRAQLQADGDIDKAVESVTASGDPDGIRKILTHTLNKRAESTAEALERIADALERIAAATDDAEHDAEPISPPGRLLRRSERFGG